MNRYVDGDLTVHFLCQAGAASQILSTDKARAQGDIMSVLLQHEKTSASKSSIVHRVDSSDEEIIPSSVERTVSATAHINNIGITSSFYEPID